MIFTPKVRSALEAKRTQFRDYHAGLQAQEGLLEEWLAALSRHSTASLTAALDESGLAWPGARPTPEFDRAPNLTLPFGNQWSSHVDARGWAKTVITGRPVAAVDGSQIIPTKDFSIPVGAVQIGWFIN